MIGIRVRKRGGRSLEERNASSNHSQRSETTERCRAGVVVGDQQLHGRARRLIAGGGNESEISPGDDGAAKTVAARQVGDDPSYYNDPLLLNHDPSS